MKKYFNKVNVSRRAVLTATALFLTAFTLTTYFIAQPANNITNATVMLTSLKGGGGSGVVLNSSAKESTILTNGHVCNVMKGGGLVTNTHGKKYTVSSYKLSALHDLCLVKVAANLNASTALADQAPAVYEAATVSGHPHLLPNVITKGHFSEHKIVNVMIGFKECTADDLSNEITAPFCAILGRVPVFRTYDTVLVTATIMPGSSGSAVYDAENNLAGLVFAGSGDLGYAFIVPYEYLAIFLSLESSSASIESVTPSYELGLNEAKTKSVREQTEALKEICKDKDNSICDILRKGVIWDDEFQNW